ncbi:MAG: helix-turn-helix transcriptional regulator [Pseudomonadota bacterium]
MPRQLKPPHPAPDEPRLARVAAQIAEPSRARMLSYLLSGEYASAGELAEAASVTPATASGHLAKLLDAGFVACEQRGRHRYYRLADAEIAHALEALALVAERGTHERAWSSPQRSRLRDARCCYGHLAGALGVGLLDTMLRRGWLQPGLSGYALTVAGAAWLDQIGMDGPAWLAHADGSASRRTAYACLDWSERRDHLAGRLAHALLDHFMSRRWLRRRPGERALDITPGGRVALQAVMQGTSSAQASSIAAQSRGEPL